jgi:hypothetical protein
MAVNRKEHFGLYILLLLGVFFLAGLLPAPASAAGGDLEITGPGLKGPGVVITREQFEGWEPLILPDGTEVQQYDEWYSSINTWPSKLWYRGQGIKLRDLLQAAGGLREEATLIRFSSSDGFRVTFTVKELLAESAYRFPNFMDTGLPGHTPGDPRGAVPVEPIVAHRSFSAHTKEEIRDAGRFSSADAYHLLFGQRAVSHQNNARFAKYVTKIEVLTDEVERWEEPRAVPPPGEVPAGTLVRLYAPLGDEDKVHYTLDGSEPTIESPMYNLVASRWWSSRGEEGVEAVNRPIEIREDTTIKAVTIGPGKGDSDIITFSYRVKAEVEAGPEAGGDKGMDKPAHLWLMPVVSLYLLLGCCGF